MKRFTLLLALSFLPGLVFAVSSGRVLYVSGKVTVERNGQLYRAVKNGSLLTGDIVETGPMGRMHMRMTDKTLISLKPNTRFQIQQYRFAEATTEAAEPRSLASAETVPDSSVFRLLKGGFRAITGLIGQRDHGAFGVSTAVATIGIRGTSFVADLSPVANPEVAALQPTFLQNSSDATLSDFDSGIEVAQNGGAAAVPVLTVGVGSGAVVLTNSRGSLLLQNGEFGQVFSNNRAPSRMLVPPADSDALAIGTSENGEVGDENDVAPPGVVNRELAFGEGANNQSSELTPQPEESEYLENLGTRKDLSVVSFLGRDGEQTQVLTISDQATRPDENGNTTAFIGRVLRDGELVPAVIELVDGVVANPGRDLDTGMQWGRWSGDSLLLRFADGSEQLVALDAAQLHLVQSASHEGEIALPMTGSMEFTLRGNTAPTDNQGHLGFLGLAYLQANFDTGTVDSALSLSINQQLWEATGTGALGSALSSATPSNVFAGQYTDVEIDGITGGDGEFAGFFTNDAATAGLTYQLRDGAHAVNGAAAFIPATP